jgi:hypothetical protein
MLSLLLIISFLVAIPAQAQFLSGIEGTILDPSGAVVPAATVTLKNPQTGLVRTIKTSDAGYFRISAVSAGVFSLTVSAAGFKTSVQNDIELQVSQMKTLNISLELGSAETEVSVTAAAPLVERSEARISTVIPRRELSELPLVGRNFFTMVVLTPGITGLATGGGQAYAQALGDIYAAEYGPNMNANGQRAEGNNFQVDSASVNGAPRGGVLNINPSPDTVEEVRISVNNFSAEYGRNSSAIVNVITKQGTNQIHGSVSEFHTNNALTSRNVFQNKVPVFRRNEFGGTFGGPIRKDRTFYFAAVDTLRSGVATTSNVTVVTPQFINYVSQRYPQNISTFVMQNAPAQVTPIASGAGSVASALYAGPLAGVVPNIGACDGLPGGAGSLVTTPIGQLPCNFQLTMPAVMNRTPFRNGVQVNGRLDHMFNGDADRFYASTFSTYVNSGTSNPYPVFQQPPSVGNNPNRTRYINVNETHLFSPKLMNETSFAIDWVRGESPYADPIIPKLTIPGISAYGNSAADAVYIQQNYEWRDLVIYNRGSHNFKMGVNFVRDHLLAKFGVNYLRPNYTFLNLYDFALDAPFSEGNIGFNMQTGQHGVAGPDMTVHMNAFGAFIQDDWKARRNLTLNLGLRWDAYLWPTEDHNVFTRLIMGSGNSFGERVANARSVVGKPKLGEDWNNFAPRLGVAWDPTDKGNLSVRAGVGMFYDRFSSQLFAESILEPPIYGVATASQQTAPIVPVYGLCKLNKPPFDCPSLPNLPLLVDSKGGLVGLNYRVAGVAGNLVTPYTFNWFFGLQYSLWNQWVVEGNYVGSTGRKLYQSYDVNRFNGSLVQNNGQLVRLNTSFGTMDYGQNNGAAHYNGGNFSIKKRYSFGLDFQAAFTFGKAMDTSSSYGCPSCGGLPVVNPINMKLQYGVSDFDISRKLAMALVYALPKATSSRALGFALNGWQLAEVTILQGSPPFTVTCSQAFVPVRDASGQIVRNSGCDYNADGYVLDRPNAPAGQILNGGLSRINYEYPNRIFAAANFPVPALGTDGNLGRNTYRGPGYASTDLSLSKSFKVTERIKTQFRADVFNAWNRVNLTQVVGDTSNALFGSSISAYPGRNIQGALRVVW